MHTVTRPAVQLRHTDSASSSSSKAPTDQQTIATWCMGQQVHHDQSNPMESRNMKRRSMATTRAPDVSVQDRRHTPPPADPHRVRDVGDILGALLVVVQEEIRRIKDAALQVGSWASAVVEVGSCPSTTLLTVCGKAG